MSRPRPFLAALRSLFVPGWGLLSGPYRRVGWVLVGSSGLVAAATLVAWVTFGPVELAARLADPTVLTVLAVVALASGGVRLLDVGVAWIRNGGHNPAISAMLALAVLTPHAYAAHVAWETRTALVEIFAPSPPPPPASPAPGSVTTTEPSTTTSHQPSTTASSLPSTTTTPLPSTATSPPTSTTVAPPSTSPPSSPPPTATTTTTAPPESLDPDRLNVLLLGGDAGPGRTGLRTDTIMVASVDPLTGDAALIGLPRNYSGFSFSDGTPFEGTILNAVYGWGRAHPDRFGGVDPGASAVRDVVSHLTGLDIDYFALVDLTGFADVVDAFGGVTIDVPRPLDAPLYDPSTGLHTMIRIPAGPQHLSGAEALAYARVRHDSSDYVRMSRQRCVLAAMVAGLDAATLLTRITHILEEVSDHVTTDIPLELVPDLIRLADRVDASAIRTLGFGREHRAGRTLSGYDIPDVELIRSLVDQLINDPDSLPPGAAPAADACS